MEKKFWRKISTILNKIPFKKQANFSTFTFVEYIDPYNDIISAERCCFCLEQVNKNNIGIRRHMLKHYFKYKKLASFL